MEGRTVDIGKRHVVALDELVVLDEAVEEGEVGARVLQARRAQLALSLGAPLAAEEL